MPIWNEAIAFHINVIFLKNRFNWIPFPIKNKRTVMIKSSSIKRFFTSENSEIDGSSDKKKKIVLASSEVKCVLLSNDSTIASDGEIKT